MKPVVDGLAKKHAGRYAIMTLNTASRDPKVGNLAQKYGIRYVPTFVFVGSDGSVSASVVGAVPAARLEQELARLK